MRKVFNRSNLISNLFTIIDSEIGTRKYYNWNFDDSIVICRIFREMFFAYVDEYHSYALKYPIKFIKYICGKYHTPICYYNRDLECRYTFLIDDDQYVLFYCDIFDNILVFNNIKTHKELSILIKFLDKKLNCGEKVFIDSSELMLDLIFSNAEMEVINAQMYKLMLL